MKPPLNKLRLVVPVVTAGPVEVLINTPTPPATPDVPPLSNTLLVPALAPVVMEETCEDCRLIPISQNVLPAPNVQTAPLPLVF